MSDSTAVDSPRKPLVEMVKRLVVSHFFHYGFVSGSRARQYLIGLGMPDSRIRVGYDCVDNDYFHSGALACRAKSSVLQVWAPQRYFLCVARLAAEKNVELLLRSFFTYRSLGGTWRLVIVGRGGFEEGLKSTARESEYSDFVSFEGYKSYPEIVPYYAFASAVVLPSKSEPWGLVLNEAMASEVPVIASNACGACEDLVIHGQTGLIFDPASERELTEAMLRMSEMTEEEYRTMAASARARVELYSLEAFRRAVLATVRAAGA